MRQKFLNDSRIGLKKKLLFFYLGASVLPILLITVTISGFYYRNLLKNAYDLVERNNQINETLICERMKNVDRSLYEFAVDQKILSLAETINGSDEKESIIAQQEMKTALENAIYGNTTIWGSAFLADNSRYVTYSRSYGSTYDSTFSNRKIREEIRQKLEQTNTVTRIAPINLSSDDRQQDYVILVGIPLRNLRTKETFGVFVMIVDCSVLSVPYETDNRNKNAVTSFVVDENGTILADTDKNKIGQSLSVYRNGKDKKDSVLEERYYSVELSGANWRIVNLIRKSVYKQEISIAIIRVVLIIIAITIVFGVLAVLVTRSYLTNIQSIVEGMQDYEKTQNSIIRVSMNKGDELYRIVRQFRSMTEHINKLIEELQQKNDDIKEASLKQKNAEIRALEAQINPHFLFNTLDTINWKAIENDEYEISEMLSSLGSLLRYSVSQIDTVVLLEAEIAWLKKYIFLQRERFDHSFDCIYDLPEAVLSFPIYKMLLQPIIENSILHAFEEVHSGGLITVSVRIQENGRLRISIKDNGGGMTKEKLEEIREEIHRKDALNGKSIGISNVINRLWIYYQDQAELEVYSVLGEGTEFVIYIPDVVEREYR